MQFKFSILIAFFAPASVFGLSCPSDVDPYEEVATAFEHSDLVFIGHTESGSFKAADITIVVDKKWKGPEVESIRLKKRWGKQEPVIMFASQSEYSGDWYESRPSCFFPHDGLTVESILLESYGNPHTPNLGASFRLLVTYGGIILLAAGGVAISSWGLRSIQK